MKPEAKEEEQIVAMKKIGMLWATIQCPQNQPLPNWLYFPNPSISFTVTKETLKTCIGT